ncbi:DUF2187 family protein [Salinicoccus sp. ID82-1]|uniref:DUF2187 domain-containing protein n=1 Tax=Salinicoccus cyprini TaxID=2493691 RepID=A0A558ATP9_9STAP|nr:DUF2187 family protein [Salinicoccus cyprini]MCG1010939.1 DUF2187 family protein [Salinicoccus sp. ID82-1]TVT27631.1 DUF2187 domain-containing protein [Salinicoccus cyprini]
MEAAKFGNIVELDGMRGKVEKVNGNSVIVDIPINDSSEEHEMFEKTIVDHKRYKIIEG